MNFKKKWFSLTIVLLSLVLVSFSTTGCGGNDDTGDATGGAGRQFISIGGNPVGMPYYQMAVALSEVITEHTPGVQATAEATSGAMENAKRINNGEMELGLTAPFIAKDCYLGQGEFEGAGGNINAVMTFYRTYCQLLALEDSNIETIADLKGKKVGLGPRGSSTNVDAMFLLEANNIKETDLQPYYISAVEAVEMMKNGQLDAVIQSGPLGLSSFLDLANSREINVVPLDDTTISKFMEEFPFDFEAVIPAGTYKGQDEDIKTIAYSHHVICDKNLSEDLVYDIVKNIYENVDELEKIHNSFADINEETYNLNEISIPLHPGALRYFEEVGAPGLDELKAKMENL